jgi:hypothetical protein
VKDETASVGGAGECVILELGYTRTVGRVCRADYAVAHNLVCVISM